MRRPSRTGFTVIELLIGVAVVGILVALIVPAVMSAREAARRTECKGHLKQIGLALHSYESSHRVYPFGVGADKDGGGAQVTSEDSRRYSAHSQLLPYLELGNVYKQIDFSVHPFYPDATGDPKEITGDGPNETPAAVAVPVFVCPSDVNRLNRPWGSTNYRSCNGSSWDGRRGNGIFGQITAVRPGDIRDGLSNTAAFSERVRGDDDRNNVDFQSDLFGLAAPWTEESFRNWCTRLTEAEAFTLSLHDSNGGMTWLEGNMNWTRYNHFFTPGRNSCKTDLTWNGVGMTATSRHAGGVHLLTADGAVRFVGDDVDQSVWTALGTIAGGERIAGEF